MFLVVRIWGGVTDLVADRRVDETSTRWARFRPYLLFALVPLAALLVAMFSIPSGLGADGKLAWAYASYALFLALVGFALYVWCFGRERSCEDLPVGSYVPITTPVVETLLSASFSPGGPL